MKDKKWQLFRIIVPIFPEINIFTRIAKTTTALGPIMVATAADKTWGWRVEVIDENNYRKGPRDKDGLPDHRVLQRENHATVVGFSCDISSTIERVWQLADFYRKQKVMTIAGGWHTHYEPEESLKKGIDVVAHGEGEWSIGQILDAIQKNSVLAVPGISYQAIGQIITNPPKNQEASNLNNLPFPNFGLLKYAELKTYPIGRIRGCSMNCEFCSINGKPNWASGEHLFQTVKYLVETRKARKFFVVDDRLEEDRDGSLIFFQLIAKKYGSSLDFTIQIRLKAAEDISLLETMKKAGVSRVCIGYESCLDEELKGMRKGYLSVDMVKWTKIFHSFGFFVHGMFIFGYPSEKKIIEISVEERTTHLKKFIRQCRLDSVQILRPVPIVGSELRKRLMRNGKVFSQDKVPWLYYDGNYTCFLPDEDDMTIEELQEIPTKIMRWFYNPLSFFRIPLKTVALPIDYFIRGWKQWYRDWHNDIIKYGGHWMLRRWRKRYNRQEFLKKLKNL